MKMLIFLLILGFFLSSCNIFQWTWDDETETSIGYYKDMYVKNIQSSDFDSALYYADKIIRKDSSLFIGYYYKAKAVRYSFFSNKYLVLQDFMKTTDSNSINNKIIMPFCNVPISRLDSIYRGAIEINKNLNYILTQGLCDNVEQENLIKLDDYISTAIYGVLTLKDINGNGTLLDDGNLMNILKIYRSGNSIKIEGLDSLYIVLKNNPEYINNMINRSTELFEKTKNLFKTLIDTTVVAQKDVSYFIKNLSESLNKYKIGDKIDNDGDSDDFEDLNSNGLPDRGEPGIDSSGHVYKDGLDNDGDGLIDEGIDEETIDGIDNDGDGLIDEDGNNLSLIG